jgi:hypothetical protein
MAEGFSERWARSVVRQLGRRDVEFSKGLTEPEIAHIGEVFGAKVPDELELFLRAGVPTSSSWAQWHDGVEAVHEWSMAWIDRTFVFDIKQNDYWHPLLGERPTDLDSAISQALAVARSAPPLIPIYEHRFISTAPTEGPHAVLSVYQVVDSIYYGFDLADYFAREFEIKRPGWATSEPPVVPVWGQLFDLLGTER